MLHVSLLPVDACAGTDTDRPVVPDCCAWPSGHEIDSTSSAVPDHVAVAVMAPLVMAW